MTITQKLTFADYLALDTAEQLPDARCELINGEWIEVPPESGLNDWFALNLRDELIKIIRRQLVRVHTCEIQVPVLQKGDAENRYPDLVVLREEHIALTQRRLTITMLMPPPMLVVEIVSPGKSNQVRDFQRKRAQYAQIGIPEYWLVEPGSQTVMVLYLDATNYSEMGYSDKGTFIGSQLIQSPTFPELVLTAAQVFCQ
jgi:Uma2 family endonuclease